MVSQGGGRELGLLIANRGEIALRIQATAAQFPLPSDVGHQHGEGKAVASAPARFRSLSIYTQAEADAAHVLAVPPEQRLILPGTGSRAYLDGEAIVRLALEHGAWGIAPGYGFLSESVAFARAVEQAGLVWLGPPSEQLALFGDKVSARQLARRCGVPILPGTSGEAEASLADVQAFARSIGGGHNKIIIKALSGGGGRGMQVVDLAQAGMEGRVEAAYRSCQREAQAAFGDGRVYAERYLEQARHIEVQIVGDGQGNATHLWERECSLQRRHQKLVEIAPSPTLNEAGATSIINSALKMARQGNYKSLGTFEFLYLPKTGEHFFMEANPRIQVEHTITEQITGVDLVALQLQIALGKTLPQIDSALRIYEHAKTRPRQTSIQLRINSEEFLPDGRVVATGGQTKKFMPPTGPGVRIDTAVTGVGYRADPAFDSLLAKVIVTAPSYSSAVSLAQRSLSRLVVEGITTNKAFLNAVLHHPSFAGNLDIHTRFIEDNFDHLLESSKSYVASSSSRSSIDSEEKAQASLSAPEGQEALRIPMAGVLASVSIKEGDSVNAGQEVAVIESMKMEHVIRADQSGRVVRLVAEKGASVQSNEPLYFFEVLDGEHSASTSQAEAEGKESFDDLREDLKAMMARKALLQDRSRDSFVKRRREAGFLTARENLDLLVDRDSFIEFGDFALAAQRSRMSEERLLSNTSGDGVITGWATVNKERFQAAIEARIVPSPARCALVIYDYLVLAGTQGHFHHLKLDRIFKAVLDNPAPLILYAEGGGGRPGDMDLSNIKVAGMDTPSFALMATIRARGYPSVGLANGYTFAGNAALLGTCDIVVATEGGRRDAEKRVQTSTGMGGPAMIEGGGLGQFKPEEVGPLSTHIENGGYDVVVPTEVEAAALVKKLISYFQGPLHEVKYTNEPKKLRTIMPRSRVRAYDVRRIIDVIADDDSFVELGAGWGKSVVTGLMRLKGQPVGVLASSVLSPLGGAIDAASALKAIRLVRMLDRTQSMHLVVLCDSPGFMVGPTHEKEGGLRIFAEFFEVMAKFGEGGGRIFAVTIRKAYGLGAQAMLGGSTLYNFVSASWPTAEYAGMGIEGAVRLAMRKELASIDDVKEREVSFRAMVDMMYERGKAENVASLGEIDTVIDPAETREFLGRAMSTARPRIPKWKRDSEGQYLHGPKL